MKPMLWKIGAGSRTMAARTSRHFGYVLIGAIGFALLTQAVPYWRDRMAMADWVSATLSIIPAGEGPPVIGYDYTATRDVEAEWRAFVEDARGNRLSASYLGNGRYRTIRGGYREWSWEAFFEADPGPRVPGVPFRVCVQYYVTAATGVTQDTGPFCSEAFNPMEARP